MTWTIEQKNDQLLISRGDNVSITFESHITDFKKHVSAAGYLTTSDSRLKNNIKIAPDATIKTQWKTYESTTELGKKRYGVLAQDLEQEHPEFVHTDDKGYKSVAYTDLLVAKNIELESRIHALEISVNVLSKAVAGSNSPPRNGRT